jgi:hypothetical protein
MKKPISLIILGIFLFGVTFLFLGILFTAQTDYQLIYTFQSPAIETKGNFGTSVAIDGDIIVIGEHQGDPNSITNAGRAYIFNTTGHLLANLTSPEPQMNANFGWSVAVSGDNVVIGEPNATVNGEPFAGRAHIFSVNGVHLKTLTTPTPTEGVEFGMSVAIDGDIVIIGTYVRVGGGFNGQDLHPSPPGTKSFVYIYDTEGNLKDTLESPSSTEPSAFGVSSAIDGDIIVIGEDHATVSGVDDAGRAYIFSTNGTPLATLESSTPTNWGVFGVTVAVHGDIVVVSEPWSWPGTIHIYDTAGNKITTLSGNYGPGIAVGSKIIVAGTEDKVDGKINAGRAYLYDLTGNSAAEGFFGSRVVAIDEGILVVGVPLEDVNGKIDTGRVYIFSVPFSEETSTSSATTAADETGTSTIKIGINKGVHSDLQFVVNDIKRELKENSHQLQNFPQCFGQNTEINLRKVFPS